MGAKLGRTDKAVGATKNGEQIDFTIVFVQARQTCKTITARRVIRLGVGEFAGQMSMGLAAIAGERNGESFESQRDLI